MNNKSPINLLPLIPNTVFQRQADRQPDRQTNRDRQENRRMGGACYIRILLTKIHTEIMAFITPTHCSLVLEVGASVAP